MPQLSADSLGVFEAPHPPTGRQPRLAAFAAIILTINLDTLAHALVNCEGPEESTQPKKKKLPLVNTYRREIRLSISQAKPNLQLAAFLATLKAPNTHLP